MRGIIFNGTAAEFTTELEVRSPGPKEVKVRMVAAGLCHSDVSVINGTIPWPAPSVLGHEGAGIVSEVGSAVTSVVPGDHIVISTLAACGVCRQCTSGRPTRCRKSIGNASQPFTLNGIPCTNFAGTSAFADETLITELQAVKIPKDVPLTSAALVGCGVITGERCTDGAVCGDGCPGLFEERGRLGIGQPPEYEIWEGPGRLGFGGHGNSLTRSKATPNQER